MAKNDMLITRTVYHGKKNEDRHDNKFARRVYDHYNDTYIAPSDFGQVDLRFFNNGEIDCKVRDNVRNRRVYVIHQFLGYEGEFDPNVGTMAQYLVVDAIKRADPDQITLIIPYQPYQRQDKKMRGRVPLSAKVVATRTEVDRPELRRILTADMHAGQQQGFYEMPVNNMEALPLFVDIYKNKQGIWIPVSPDTGGAERARQMAKKLHSPGIAIIDKRRPKPGESKAMNVIGDVDGKNAVMIDDMVDTAGTLAEGSDALKQEGAELVDACGTHGILSMYKDKKDNKWKYAPDRIMDSKIDNVYVSDSIPLKSKFFRDYPKFKEVSIAPLISDSIYRIENAGSISQLFGHDI